MPLDPKTADLMLTDFSAWENTLDDTQRQQLETTFKYEPDRVAAQKRFAAVASVAAYTGSDVQDVSNRFEDYYMHAFARDEQVGFGLKGGVKDINEFDQLLTERANVNKAKVATFKSANEAAVDSALRGSSSLNDFAAWQLQNEHLPEAFSDNAYKVWQKTYSDVENELGKDGRAAASRAFRAMRSMTGVSEESDAWMNEAKRNLIDLRVRSPKAYDLALASVQLMAQDAGGVDKGIIQGFGEKLGRGISDIIEGAFFVKPLIEMSQDASEAMVKAGITNAENPERLAAQIRARREVENDIVEISRGVIDPVKKTREGLMGYAEDAVYFVGSSLPYMAGYMVPGGQGQIAITGSFTSDNYNTFRSSGWEGTSAVVAAVSTGSFEAAVENASRVVLKIPGVASLFNKFGVKPGSSWATQFFLRSVAQGGTEVVEEVIQEATAPFVQELANAIIPSIPDTPEGKHLSDVMSKFFEAENFAPLVLSILPLGMIGAGMSTSQDMNYLNDVQSFFGNDAASEIMAEADPAKRDAMIRERFKAMPAEELAKRARIRMETMARRTGQSFQNEQDIEAFQDTTSPEYTVSVTRAPSGWQVRMGDGNVIQVESAEAARRIAVDLRQVGSQQEADTLVGVIDSYYEQGKQAETVLTGETVMAQEIKAGEGRVFAERRNERNALISQRDFGPKALETVREEAEVAGIKSNTRGVFAHINGSNEVFPMRVADGAKEIVRRMNLYKSQAEGQPQVITFLHENFESTWQLGMANGTFSEQETRTAMRALLPAFEGVTALNAEESQFIANLRTLASGKGNETMLRETVSEMVIRDVLGRDRQGRATGMKPGSISRAIEASVMGANTQEEASALKSILAAIKAFTAYLKGVFGTVDAMIKANEEGKIGAEYDTFINKVLGIDEVKQMESQTVDEVKAMLGVDEDAGMTISIAPVTETVDGDFFSDPDTFYRVIHGDAAFNDLVQSGLVRTNAGSKGGATLAEKLAARPTAFPSFNKGSAAMSYAAEDPSHYIITTTDSSMQPSTSGRHSKGSTMFPTDSEGNHLKFLDGSKVDVWKHMGDGQYQRVYSKGSLMGVDAETQAVIDAGNMAFSISAATNLAESKRNDPLMQRKIKKWKKSREEMGKALEEADDDFFNVFWPELMKAAGQRLKPSLRNINEAARRSVDDILGWLKQNPKYLNYYADDWNTTRNILDITFPNFTDDDFVGFRLFTGLTSPATPLRGNLADAMQVMNLWQSEKSFGKLQLERSAKGNRKVKDGNPFKLQSNTGANKIFTLKVIEGLFGKLENWEAVNSYLNEGITSKELNAFNKEMGYAGGVSDIGDIRRVVNEATGQDKLIPRMFIFGPKVGAYTLNATGDSRFTTTDIWESRFIRSYFPQMFENGTGLPINGMEHEIFQNFASAFKRTIEVKMGQDFEPSALQAVRWFYMIFKSREAGYKYGSTSGTISDYAQLAAKQYLGINFDDNRGGGRGNAGNGSRDARAESSGANVVGPTFSISPAQDAEYLNLAKDPEKNRTLLQRMVDAAAKTAGFTVGPVWHGSNSPFNIFDRKKAKEGRFGKGFYFTPDEASAKNYGNESVRVRGGELTLRQFYLKGDTFNYKDAIRVAFDPSQIKSADPITYDDAGNIIPLSQRFNEATPDIRFSISPVNRVSKSEFNEKLEELQTLDLEDDQFTMPKFNAAKDKLVDTIADEAHLMVRGKDAISPFGAHELFIVDNDDKPIGFVRLTKSPEQISINMIYIDEDYRGRGIGSDFYRYWLDKGVSIKSDKEITDGTAAIYQKLASEGYGMDIQDDRAVLLPRLNETASKVSFSISPVRNLNELSDQVEKQFAENPVGALEVKSRVIRQFAKLADKWSNERWTPQGNKIRPISEKRTVKSLDKEQAMRQAQREVELVNEGMDKLTPDTLMAYSEGVGTLQDDPLIARMLNDNGKLMSKATAEREGRGIKDQYDDAGWLPPSFYTGGTTITTVIVTRADGSNESYDARKVPDEVKAEISNGSAKAVVKKTRTPAAGGIMPDVMANNLGFDYASEMWAALESSIKSHRTAKAGYAKAEDAVKAVERAAFEQARKEAQAWRTETDAMQKEDWSPRESLVRDLITLEAIIAMFPQEIRGKIGGFVALARKASESARLKVLQKQLERGQVLLEKHLKEQYGEATEKLLKRFKSQKDASGRITGKIISTATEQVDYAAEFIKLGIEEQADRQAALEKKVEESEDANEVQDALTKLGIARLFDMYSDKDSASRESAFIWLNDTIEAGKLGKSIMDEARKEMLAEMRQSAQSSILAGDELNPDIADNITNLNKGVLKSAILRMRGVLSSSLWTTLQRLELIFGEDSKILNYFAEKIINAANLSTDIKRLVEAQKKDALSIIFNSDSKFAHARGIAELQKVKQSGISTRRVKKEEVKLDIETLTKLNDGTMSAETAGLRQDEVDAALEEFAANARKSTVTIEKVINAGTPVERMMSETQGIQWWLWSMQDASRKQMERDGWDADSFKQLEEFLSPEAKALGRWISGSYQDAAGMIDPIYRKLFNAPLPRTKNYSPIHRRNMNTGGDIMDIDGSDMNSGLAAGFTKARVNTTASLVEMDALAVFLAHWENVSHWVSHAELMRDMKAILLDKDTAVAIRQKKSEGYLQRLKEDVKTIESNGTSSARELVDISRMWRWFMQFRSYKGLAFRLSPIIKQTPALLNPLIADVPAHNYMMGMARAFIEPQSFAKEVSAMWSSDIIRRRIESGFSAESRVAMQGTSMTGSQAILVMQAGMMPMSMVDGGWTALGAAISFDYYRRGYMRENPQMTPEVADAKAIARVEKMIATSAQPSDIYARALYERSGNVFMRSMAMFVSDQRKTLAIELMAIRRLATGKSKNKALDVQRAIVAHFVMAAVSQTAAIVIASLLGDDEDRDRELSAEQWTLALSLGPVNGLFVAGRLFDKAGRYFINSDFYQRNFGTGQKLSIFPDDNLAEKAFLDIYKAGKNMDDLFNPNDADDFMDALDSSSAALGAGMSAVGGPAGGAVDVGANVLREARKIQKRLSE